MLSANIFILSLKLKSPSILLTAVTDASKLETKSIICTLWGRGCGALLSRVGLDFLHKIRRSLSCLAEKYSSTVYFSPLAGFSLNWRPAFLRSGRRSPTFSVAERKTPPYPRSFWEKKGIKDNKREQNKY